MIADLLRLLAQQDIPFLHIGDRFRLGNSSLSAASVLLVVCIAGGVAGIVWLLVRWTQRQEQGAYHSPRKLWQELCRVHKLTWSETRLLRSIAGREKLTEPCELFLEPAYLERAASSGNPPALDALRERLLERK